MALATLCHHQKLSDVITMLQCGTALTVKIGLSSTAHSKVAHFASKGAHAVHGMEHHTAFTVWVIHIWWLLMSSPFSLHFYINGLKN